MAAVAFEAVLLQNGHHVVREIDGRFGFLRVRRAAHQQHPDCGR
jgi:hypothetical protein